MSSSIITIVAFLVIISVGVVSSFSNGWIGQRHYVQLKSSRLFVSKSKEWIGPLEEEEDNNHYDHGVDNTISHNISRRSAIESSGKMLAALLLSSTSMGNGSMANAALDVNTNSSNSIPQTIIVTGCNSGIGFDAVKRMAERGHTIIMACRTLKKASDAASQIQNELSNAGVSSAVTSNLIPKECDLSDFKSIKAFVNDIVANEKLRSIDALCLNAGIARNTSAKDVLRTKQSFELTIGTNHLGHFYLTQLILPLLLENNNGEIKQKRIVVTASGVHDPDSPGGAQGSKATLGDLSGLENMVTNGVPFDMIDGGEYDADKAYKDSKLCNVLFTRHLQRRLNESASGKNIHVNCFNPGLIVSTGLFRDQNQVFTKVFDFAATDLLKVGENVHWGGGALEYMTLDSGVGTKGGLYYTSPPGSSKYGDDAFGNQFVQSEVSIEARDDDKARRLWELSEKLVNTASS